MIPFSILSGQLLAEGNSIQEISILDMSRIGFPFRVPKSFHKSWDAIRLQFYCRKELLPARRISGWQKRLRKLAYVRNHCLRRFWLDCLKAGMCLKAMP